MSDTPETSSRPAPNPWRLEDAGDTYGLDAWGAGYFGVNERGHVEVRAGDATAIDLKQLVDDLRRRGVQTPILLRFTDVLNHRIGRIAGAFGDAIDRFGYGGAYACIYPIKVNQQADVVKQVLRSGRAHGFGLEAGSKPELLAIMALVADDDTPIVCNGFKDESFIEAVVLATKIGRNIIPVVEKFSELRSIIRQARKHGVRPRIGMRVKLTSGGSGRWQQSGGPRSKFGLFLSELLDAVETLRREDMLGALKMLHFHIGSQVSEIRAIKEAIGELARVYTELRRDGAPLEYLDVGGGLGVDYDGSSSATDSSVNYTLEEYANNVIFHVQEACDAAGVEHPTILTESGRALVAHHSVLIVDVVGWSGFDRFEIPDDLEPPRIDALPPCVRTLYESYHGLTDENHLEYFHDTVVNREEAHTLFRLGHCSLADRALAERLFFGISSKVQRIVQGMDRVPDELAHLETMLADTYFCNCSIFQSLPDSWAIGQLFPVVPIHRLGERPTCRGVLADITCDSDGRVDRFPGRAGRKRVLELHPYTGGDYLLGVFLVGAYQEILGDLHNLFGDTNAVHVSRGADGQPSIDEIIEGDRVADVLRYVQFDPDRLRRRLQRTIEEAIRGSKISLDEVRFLNHFYEQGLAGYTYLT